jgi:hypothetical protein
MVKELCFLVDYFLRVEDDKLTVYRSPFKSVVKSIELEIRYIHPNHAQAAFAAISAKIRENESKFDNMRRNKIDFITEIKKLIKSDSSWIYRKEDF